jgi:hypothetical protein
VFLVAASSYAFQCLLTEPPFFGYGSQNVLRQINCKHLKRVISGVEIDGAAFTILQSIQ